VFVGLLLVLLPVAQTLPRAPHAGSEAPPQVLFKDLFVAVQTSSLLADSKVFVDAVPLSGPKLILAEYHTQHPDSPEALKRFLDAHFKLPAEASTATSPPDRVPIVTHIDRLWDPLTRRTPTAPPYSSLLPVPEPYVVPGGRFREMYYWDSYFTMLGLDESGRHDLVQAMVRDFAYLVDTYGHIPNGLRTYYLSRSQPPFFFAMVGLLERGERVGGDPSAAPVPVGTRIAGSYSSGVPDPSHAAAVQEPFDPTVRFLKQLRREYAFWMSGSERLHPGTAYRRVVALPDGSILNRYWDDRDTPRDESFRADLEVARNSGRKPSDVFRDLRAAAESGWDFSSRWFADGHSRATVITTEIIPVDLNSLLFGLENAIHDACERAADSACAREFARRGTARRKAMDQYLWDAESGSYLDYRWTRKSRIPGISAATVYPLFAGAASDAEASSVAAAVARDLVKDGGIVTTTLQTGEQWDAPNGWAPLQWMAVSGLRRYGKMQEAEAIACRFMLNVNHVYEESGKLVEKYDVVNTGRKGGGGEYPLQDGFGWTNGVMRKLMAMYPADAGYARVEQCPKPSGS
jgi:alpha,alpha-trehalase